MKSILRALWGFVTFIPFCWLWGVQNFTWFSLVGTLYFIPVHWLFDRFTTMPYSCALGLHKWEYQYPQKPYDSIRKCIQCKKIEECGFDGLDFDWSEVKR